MRVGTFLFLSLIYTGQLLAQRRYSIRFVEGTNEYINFFSLSTLTECKLHDTET